MQLTEKENAITRLLSWKLKTHLVRLLVEESLGIISNAQQIPEELCNMGCVIIFPNINDVTFPKLTRLGRRIALHFIDPQESSPLYNHLQIVLYTKKKLKKEELTCR